MNTLWLFVIVPVAVVGGMVLACWLMHAGAKDVIKGLWK